MLIQALVAELAVDALDICVLDRLARPDECQADVVLVGPGVERPTLELGTMIDGDRYGWAAAVAQTIENGDHALAGQ